jgi:2-methylaconitate cis-trans-isomerase PrpF
MTGTTFPTGNRQDDLLVNSTSLSVPFTVRATLIDVSNPFILVDSSTMPSEYHAAGPDAEISLEVIESIRRQGAVNSGLAVDTESAGLRRGTPKIALLSKAPPHAGPDSPDISALAYSMGKVHPSVQLTGAVCLGAATCLSGTVASELARSQSHVLPVTPRQNGTVNDSLPVMQNGMKTDGRVVIAHNSGTIDVDVDVSEDDQVQSVTVFRTVRRLFEGHILVPL